MNVSKAFPWIRLVSHAIELIFILSIAKTILLNNKLKVSNIIKHSKLFARLNLKITKMLLAN